MAPYTHLIQLNGGLARVTSPTRVPCLAQTEPRVGHQNNWLKLHFLLDKMPATILCLHGDLPAGIIQSVEQSLFFALVHTSTVEEVVGDRGLSLAIRRGIVEDATNDCSLSL